MLRKPSLIAVAAVLSSAPVFAVPFTAPSWATSSTPLATAVDENRTYQQWDIFNSAAGPNSPLTYNINPYTTAANAANAFDSAAPGSGAFVTSGGNIYSPTGIIKPRALVPLANLSGNVENVTVEISLGAGSQAITPTDFTVNGAAVSTLSNYVFTDNTDAASSTQRYLYTFTIPDIATLQLDWGWDVTSGSLDAIAIQTQSVATPEPASLALLGIGGAALLRRRRA